MRYSINFSINYLIKEEFVTAFPHMRGARYKKTEEKIIKEEFVTAFPHMRGGQVAWSQLVLRVLGSRE